jgi:uncharacterized membrane protein
MNKITLTQIAKTALNYFLKGLLFVLPVYLSGYIIYSLFQTIDRILNLSIPGIGFVVVITSITLIGFIGNRIFGQTILDFIDDILERTPGVKYIYNLIKDFMEAFVGDKRRFTEPVMFEVHDGIYKLGFVTQRDLANFNMLEHCGIYCPKCYGMMGDLIIVKRDKIKKLDKNPTQVMTFIVSGGVTDIG